MRYKIIVQARPHTEAGDKPGQAKPCESGGHRLFAPEDIGGDPALERMRGIRAVGQ